MDQKFTIGETLLAWALVPVLAIGLIVFGVIIAVWSGVDYVRGR